MDTSLQFPNATSESLISELELIERYGDRFSYSELMDAARKTRPVLELAIEHAPSTGLKEQAETARRELQKIFLDPNSLTDGLIAVILTIALSAIRRIVAAS